KSLISIRVIRATGSDTLLQGWQRRALLGTALPAHAAAGSPPVSPAAIRIPSGPRRGNPCRPGAPGNRLRGSALGDKPLGVLARRCLAPSLLASRSTRPPAPPRCWVWAAGGIHAQLEGSA